MLFAKVGMTSSLFGHYIVVDDICVGDETYDTTYIDWLYQNYISCYTWTQFYNPKECKSYLAFRFKNDQDKILFALRWA